MRRQAVEMECWGQELVFIAPLTAEESNNWRKFLILTSEEYFAVCEWLVRHGYADEGELDYARKILLEDEEENVEKLIDKEAKV